MLRKTAGLNLPRALWVATALFVGCASSQLAKVGSEDKELPKDLQDKFEVKEPLPTPGAEPSPAPTPEEPGKAKLPAAAKKKKAAKKIEKKAAVPEASPAAFVFPNRRPPADPIWPGESQVYDVSYFGVSAGDFTLEVQPYKLINNRKAYHARGTAVSSSVFSIFYRLNDMVETFFDFEGFFSHRFHIVLDETKQTRDSLELNDSEKAQTYYWNKWNRPHAGYVETKEYFPIQPFSQDSMSALYYLRSRDLPDGAVVTFPVISEGKTWEAVATVLRRETIATPVGKLKAIVIKPEHKYQGILQTRGDSFVWLTDDDRKFMIRLEAKVKIGTVVAMLKKLERGTPPAEK
ncbi:MAG: DUF3108 domain-containing protein [Oligoflexia bacterium]|nr:DUF3108 domain-containing protein [Oligoflexia bacterium]